MSHALRYSLTVAVFCLLLVAGIVVMLFLVRNAINQNNAAWCDSLKLLTSHPVARPINPKGNPSRETGYLLFQDFLTLQRRFGC